MKYMYCVTFRKQLGSYTGNDGGWLSTEEPNVAFLAFSVVRELNSAWPACFWGHTGHWQ